MYKRQGWYDVDLSEKGVSEAKAAGKLLKEEGYRISQRAAMPDPVRPAPVSYTHLVGGSIPSSPTTGSLAQLVEQLTFNQLVAGSNPARPTNFKHWFRVEIFQVTPVWVVSSVGRAVDF